MSPAPNYQHVFRNRRGRQEYFAQVVSGQEFVFPAGSNHVDVSVLALPHVVVAAVEICPEQPRRRVDLEDPEALEDGEQVWIVQRDTIPEDVEASGNGEPGRGLGADFHPGNKLYGWGYCW